MKLKHVSWFLTHLVPDTLFIIVAFKNIITLYMLQS
jgi:hypothetical protein